MSTKKENIALRKNVQIYASRGLSNSAIARKLGVSRSFVIKWRNIADVNEDKRGWNKGKKRKYNDVDERIVVNTRKYLEENKSFFGAIAIQQETEIKPSLDFIKRSLRKHKLTFRQRKRSKGGSKYLLYPANLIDSLGAILCQIDFIGPRYLKGSSDPIHFLSVKYVKPFKLHLFFESVLKLQLKFLTHFMFFGRSILVLT